MPIHNPVLHELLIVKGFQYERTNVVDDAADMYFHEGIGTIIIFNGGREIAAYTCGDLGVRFGVEMSNEELNKIILS
jgi:hypothetical protein